MTPRQARAPHEPRDAFAATADPVVAQERVDAVLPHSETREFSRLDHFGIDQKAPQEVARAVSASFLTEQIAH